MKNLVHKVFSNEFNESSYKELVLNLFNRFDFSKKHTLRHQFNEDEKQKLIDFSYLSTFEDRDNKSIDVLVVELKGGSKVKRARSLQRNLIGKYLKANLKDSALVAFYSNDNPDWRLSFVKMDYRITEKGVKVDIGTSPKRYSFLVGKTEPIHTAQKQLLPLLDDRKVPSIEDIEKAFSVERVTKDFYTEIAKKFTELVGGERRIGAKKIEEKGLLKYPKPDDTLRKEFAVRLIGRILFCWFLKKKKSDKGIPLLPEEILSSFSVEKYKNYYHNLLEPLFFQVLNTPVDKRLKEFRNNLWVKIPFLNGGLFEPHLYDFYEIYHESGISRYINILNIPDSWFKDLFNIFETYNFTIDESTSIDVDISVDPEMLGRIFENLLAEINPETGETARKSTGSYYTPRPIVEYMVDESLKQYLVTHTGIDERKLSKLLSYVEDDTEITESEEDAIIDALDKAKIIDPACGSGAFPMGILHKMLLILQKIDPKSKKWLTRKLARIDNKVLRDEAEKKLKRENWDYVHKLGIIQNSIYGVDIQPIAVEISKLRFFLSLVVDETIDDSKPDRGIEPLPNLEFKFVAANSLIGLPLTSSLSQMELFEARAYINKLKELRDAYFTSYGEEKNKIEKEFQQLQNEMFEYARKEMVTHKKTLETQTLKLSQWNPFSDEASSWFDPEWMFGVRDGFDVVIANPPYVKQERIKEQKDSLLKAGYETYNSTSDIYTYFYEKAWQLLKPNGVLCFISSNKWMRAKYGKKLRRFFRTNTEVINLIDFGGFPVFEATVDTNIILFKKKQPEKLHKVKFVNVINKSDDKDLIQFIEENQESISQKQLDDNCWTLADEKILRLKEKIEKIGTPLKDWDVNICFGIKTGFNEAFIIDNGTKERLCKEDPKSIEILKPILRGRDIQRYSYKWAGLWLIKIESGWTNKRLLDSRFHGNDKKGRHSHESGNPEKMFQNTYPAIYKHLKSKGENKSKGKGLYHRDDQGDYWWELRDCAYYPEFEKEKIVWQRVTKQFSFTLVPHGIYILDSMAFMIADNAKYALSVLNSKLIDFYVKTYVHQYADTGFLLSNQYVERIPIPKIPESEQKPFIELVDKILGITKDNDYLENPTKQAKVKEYERQIDQMVYKLYGLTQEEIKIVEESK